MKYVDWIHMEDGTKEEFGSETSLQAQVLIPLVASVVFGMITSTVLILMVLPASYTILEDLGFVEVAE